MAKSKKAPSQAEVDLKVLETARIIEIEQLYKDVAKVKKQVDYALTHIGFMDNCESLSHAAFRAGRAYGPLDEANDKLEEVLEAIFNTYDFDHWDDIIKEN
jgi:hypothetical protein